MEDGPKRNTYNTAESCRVSTHRPDAVSLQFGRAAEKRLRWTLALHLVPTVALRWLFCFIDCANIGNARIAGLDESLGLRGYDYNLALTCFYIAYIVFKLPAITICKVIGPGLFIPATSLLFGACSVATTAFVQSREALCGVRFLLGVFEAGLLPGISYHLSRWYKRAELTFRLPLFLVMSPLAGAIGGLFASAILKLDHFGSLAGWRMIFAIEGIITTVLALASFFTLTNRPETAVWMTTEEQDLCATRLKADRNVSTEVVIDDGIDRVKLWRGIASPATLSTGLTFLFSNITVQGLAVFLPTSTKTIYPNASTVQLQLYSVPPYIGGAFFDIAVPALSWIVDKRQIMIIASTPTIIAGYILFLVSETTAVRYTACFLIACSAFIIGPLSAAQVSANVVSDTSRSSALGMNMMLGNIGGLISCWTYLSKDSPRYGIGNSINLFGAVRQLSISTMALFWLTWDNRRRDQRHVEDELVGMSENEVEDLDWKHPGFRWKL